ncbi:MAG: amino acid adenylation domain-containing protein [Cyclobacteriaceae bacterium]
MQNLSKENIHNIYNLSPMQEGMYFHALLDAGTAYMQQVAYRVEGNLQPGLVRQAFELLSTRYDILRTVFVQKSTRDILQVVLKEVRPDFTSTEMSSETDQEAILDRLKIDERERPFDLKKEVAFRMQVVQLDEQTFEVVWTYHHILLDGWSLAILLADFLDIYKALDRGRKPELAAAKQFREYVRWLGNYDSEESLGFWQQYLSGYDRMAQIPKNTSNKEIESYRPGHVTISFDEKESKGLEEVAGKCGATVSLVFQAMWGLLLSRHQEQDDVVFGTVVSGRPADIAGIEATPGMFINVVPVRLTPGPDMTFTGLLKIMQKEAVEALPHHYTPLVEVQRSSELPGGLFNHIMAFENYPIDERIAEGRENKESFRVKDFSLYEHTTYDFNLSVIPGQTFSIRFDFNQNVFTREKIEHIGNRFKMIADQVLARPGNQLKELSVQMEQEQTELLQSGRGQVLPVNGEATVNSLFAEQAAKTPDALAIETGNERLSFRQLDDQARRLAQHLQQNGSVQQGDAVAVFMGRSADTIVSMLAIMHCGASFVPVDTAYPSARKEHIINRSRCKALITQSSHLMDLTFFSGFLVALDVEADQFPEARQTAGKASAGNTAYILFTSGTTGQPKGVQVSHRNFVNYISWANTCYFNDREEFSMPFFTSPSFDLTLTSIFSPLLRGGKVYLPSQDDTADILEGLFGVKSPVQAVKMTPSHIRLLKNLALEETSVSTVIAGGEALQEADVKTLLSLNPDMVIYNEYGPTETTVGASVKKIDQADKNITIGRPIANTRIYITDSRQNLLPAGAAGEILIAGSGVACGYADDDEATALKFINDPWGEGKAYRTGDLGRWLPDGELAYEGRTDAQVKVNGHRIEPQEISSLLLDHKAISAAHVAARPSATGEAVLIAYYQTASGVTEEALREHLGRSLPAFMMPRFLVKVEELPLTVNGKVHTAALPEPKEILESRKAAYKAPSGEVQAFLAGLFTQVLGAEKPGADDDFFRLGGDSLKVIQLVNLASEKFPDALQVGDVFNGATLAELGTVISKRMGMDKDADKEEDFQEFEL